ncbi:MAG TPA: phytanoyl-CoA dioxygenase family protein [Caulobacteraceae bacterium]|nr:phytanoyl-CoA dioxygenase family protein [Caulobacteraceae bacterium]
MPLDTADDPYAVPEDLAPRIDALDLRSNIHDLVDDGYTVIQDPVAHALTDRVRAAIIECAQATEGRSKGYAAGLLLGRDPVFAEAIVVPKLLALVEYLLGRGFIFSQLVGSIRKKGPGSLGLHADNSWFPAPFPPWEIMCTACWVTDEFTEEAGSTLVMPGTHKRRSHPPRDVRKTLEGARPIVAPKGSLALWNGNVWHGNYPRQIEGERVVLHMTYTRLGFAPVEDYRHLDDAWLADQPPQMATLLGRDHFLGKTTVESGGAVPSLLRKTYEQVHGPQGY